MRQTARTEKEPRASPRSPLSARYCQPSSKVPPGADDAGLQTRRSVEPAGSTGGSLAAAKHLAELPAELARKQFHRDFQNARVIPTLQF